MRTEPKAWPPPCPCQVHCNNMFSRGVKIFSAVSCVFKPRLVVDWELQAVEFLTVLDDRNPSARYVTVPLGRRAGKALRCRFSFADTWMMFSEISFQAGEQLDIGSSSWGCGWKAGL